MAKKVMIKKWIPMCCLCMVVILVVVVAMLFDKGYMEGMSACSGYTNATDCSGNSSCTWNDGITAGNAPNVPAYCTSKTPSSG